MSSIVCGSGRCSVSGSSSVSRPAAVDRPPNSRPGSHGRSVAYTLVHPATAPVINGQCAGNDVIYILRTLIYFIIISFKSAAVDAFDTRIKKLRQ